MSTKIQGVALISKFNDQVIATKGDPFLPLRLNEGTRDKPRFFDLRVFADGEVLERLKALVAKRRSLVVRSSGVRSIISAYTNKDGQTVPDLAYSTDLKRLEVYDNDARTWRRASEVLNP